MSIPLQFCRLCGVKLVIKILMCNSSEARGRIGHPLTGEALRPFHAPQNWRGVPYVIPKLLRYPLPLQLSILFHRLLSHSGRIW